MTQEQINTIQAEANYCFQLARRLRRTAALLRPDSYSQATLTGTITNLSPELRKAASRLRKANRS